MKKIQVAIARNCFPFNASEEAFVCLCSELADELEGVTEGGISLSVTRGPFGNEERSSQILNATVKWHGRFVHGIPNMPNLKEKGGLLEVLLVSVARIAGAESIRFKDIQTDVLDRIQKLGASQ